MVGPHPDATWHAGRWLMPGSEGHRLYHDKKDPEAKKKLADLIKRVDAAEVALLKK